VTSAPDLLAVALLPGVGDAERTRASVQAEVGPDVPVVDLAELEPGGEGTVAFVRAGDRWREGALAARARTFAGRPEVDISIAGHVLVDATGSELLQVASPAPPLDPMELLLRASVEPAAVLVRAGALHATALEQLAQPYGDAVVWSRLAREGFVRSTELAADVLLDVERHGGDPTARFESLRAAATAGAVDDAEEPGETTVRRDLLRRLFVDAAGDASPPLDLLTLAGAGAERLPSRVLGLLADLQWTLERQREALRRERSQWPPPSDAPEIDGPTRLADEELFDLRAAIVRMSSDIEIRDTLIRRYEAEIYRRDALLARMSGETLGTEAVADAAHAEERVS
jgi:hypothetical protein